MLVAVVGRGQIFGELAVIDRGPRAMSARAMEDFFGEPVPTSILPLVLPRVELHMV